MPKSKSILLIKESFFRFFSTIATKSGALIFAILLARFLKPEGFGIYNLAMSIVLTFVILTDVGINSSLLRYFSNALSRDKKDLASAYFKYFLNLKLKLILIVSILLLALSWPLTFFVFKKPDLFLPLIILSFYLIVLSLENFFEYLVYALQKVKYIFAKEFIFQLVKILLAVAVFLILTEKFYVSGIIVSLLLAQLGVILFFLIMLGKNYSFIFKKSESKIDKKRIWRFMKYLAIGSLSTMFFAYVDVIMLGIFLPSEYVGYYSASISLFGTFVALMAISNLLVPVFVQLNSIQLRISFNKLFKYLCMFSIPLTFGAIVLGKSLIVLFYGYEYLPASIPFYFLAPVIFSGIIIDILISLFSAKEKPKYFVKMLLVTAFMNILLNYILITSLLKISFEFAIAGAAISTLVTRYFYMVSIGFNAKKVLKIRFRFSYFIKPFFAGAIMFLGILLINHFTGPMNILKGILEIIFGMGIYFLILFLIRGVGKEEFDLVRLFKKQINFKKL